MAAAMAAVVWMKTGTIEVTIEAERTGWLFGQQDSALRPTNARDIAKRFFAVSANSLPSIVHGGVPR